MSEPYALAPEYGYDRVERSPTAEAVFQERLAALRRFLGTAGGRT